MRSPAILPTGKSSSYLQRPQAVPLQRVKHHARFHVEAVARAQGEYSTNRLTLTPPANPAGSPLSSHAVPSVATSRVGDVSRLGRPANTLSTSIPALQSGSGTETAQQQQDRPTDSLSIKAEASDSKSSITSLASSTNGNGSNHNSSSSTNGRTSSPASTALSGASSVLAGVNSNLPPAPITTRTARTGSADDLSASELQTQLKQLRSALEIANMDRLHAEARAREAEVNAQQAQDALVQAQESSTSLNRQYSALCDEIDLLRTRESSGGVGPSPRSLELSRQVDDLQAQLEDLDYRLGWALRDLRAHQLVLRAQGELNMHLSGLPNNMQQQIFDQVDSGAELLGDGGSATVHAITLNGEPLAVKVMPLYDINTARPYHFRDICTTFLRHQRSPYIEMPLHTFLRLKDDEVEGTQYYLYTVWPRRHMDVDQLLCRRNLRPLEILTVMHHTVLALQDLALARMVHADVKPPNVLVMLGADGLVQSAHLTDFGSVQFVPPGEEASPAIWDNQLAWNWPPEQRDWVYLESCDVWGLGLLYSCMKVINPSKPEVTDTLQDVGTSKSEFDRVRDTELLPTYTDDPAEIRTLTLLMRRCVVQDAKQRPSIKELAQTISKLHEQMQQRLATQQIGGKR